MTLATRTWFRALRARRLSLRPLFACCGLLPFFAFAQIPPPGTVIQNTATSSQLVGGVAQTVTSNTTSLTVGVAPPAGAPVLTKNFGATAIPIGGSTPLVFRLSNSVGNPSQTGIAFTDTLPAGLRLAPGATGAVVGPGCSGTVTLTPPSTVVFSAGAMTGGTVVCDINISGVTDVGIANPSCAASPPSFTNGPSSISGLANANNGVSNQCLVIDPTLTVSAVPQCVRHAPYVDYNATVLGVGAPAGMTITWRKTNGEVVQVLTGQPLSGRLLWPGAAVDAGGNPTAWPGWALLEGEWVQINDGLRPDMEILFQVNPSAQATVSYPASTATCNPNPPNVSTTPDMTLAKFISDDHGPSPSGPYTVMLRFANPGLVEGIKKNVTVSDALPAGMTLVPGTLKLTTLIGAQTQSLLGSNGTFTFGGTTGSYDTSGNNITVEFAELGQNVGGLITFEVSIAPGIQVDAVLRNTARYKYTRATGITIAPRSSNTFEFRITGTETVKLVGMTIPFVEPGATATFENVLTNLMGRTDSFDISLGASNFPAGTVIRLFKPDGVTPLADSNGNGVPDTGPVSAGATYKIIVKATLPNGAAGGPYSVTKSAQSISNVQVRAQDQDTVTAIASLCRVTFEADNSGRIAPGGTLVYSHVITNVGNCTERITVPDAFLSNSLPGWTVQVFVDGPSSSGGAIAGVLDQGDQPLGTSTVFNLAPGARTVLLVRLVAPANAILGVANLTTIRINAGNSGPLSVRDTTTVSGGTVGQVIDEITSFIDPGFLRPTVWGFIGKPLYLRASAPSCNADPTVIERRTIIITGPNGEREEIFAVETAADSGIFIADSLMVRLPPVAPGNGNLEGRPYDVYQVELVGCGKRISTTVTLIDPSGIVFDSRTNQPVQGATVTVVTATGGVCSNQPASVSLLEAGRITPAPNPVVTAADGRYEFPLLAPGDYCVRVSPPNGYTWVSTVPATQLPGGRNILATGPTSGGSYGGVFRVGPETGPVTVDIPVDGGRIGGLSVQKLALRTVVEIGEMLDYSILVSNNTGYALSQADVLLTDSLPAGFTFVKGSAKRDATVLEDPAGGVGPRLVFNLGRMAKGQQVKVSYRVRVGPGAAQGDGINSVIASYRVGTGSSLYSESNVATAKVTVSAGLFSDRGFILGKVFSDCNKNGVQDQAGEGEAESGIPGIRIYLEDGTNVTTDSEGKFSFYGILARTHVLKLDRTTFPTGVSAVDFGAISSRHLGRGDSRIVDLKNGEMQSANFALQSCTEDALQDIKNRRKQAAAQLTEVDGRLQQKLEADPNLRASNDIKALPAAGVIGLTAPVANIPATAAIGSGVEVPVTRALASQPDKPLDTNVPQQGVTGPAEPDLEAQLAGEDNTPGFIGIVDGAQGRSRQIVVKVKGMRGARFSLQVNGNEVPQDRVGKKVVVADRQMEAWEFLGVNLSPGDNVLKLRQLDEFGNERGEKTINIVAAGQVASIQIDVTQAPTGGWIADGKSPAKIVVRLLDLKKIPVLAKTLVTIESSLGRIAGDDLNQSEPGLQVFVEGGTREFLLTPPDAPGEAAVRVTAGETKAQSRVDFMPDLREMIGAGIIEGVLNLRKLDTRALRPARAQDGFEQELTHISRQWGDGRRDAAARAAMFLKGKVKGEYLLTLAYDSDKNTRERLFRDIQPDEFYPVYGDSSIRAFDAQSTGRFYVRVDNKKSYLLYGDYNTSQSSEARKLASYNRSLTGLKQHFETGSVSTTLFASRDSTRQVVDEIRANGTSGPFVLSRATGLTNSEKIEVLVRDRNQPAVVLRTTPYTRFVDYDLEPLTGRLLLKAPLASLDEGLNPVFLKITYEVDQGGDAFWVAGGDVQVRISDTLEVGATYVQDQNPLDKFKLAGINAVAKLAEKSILIAEIAQTRRNQVLNTRTNGERSGYAERIEIRHADGPIEANVFAARADENFDNPSSSLAKGRTEMGGKLGFRFNDSTRLKAELLRTEDNVTSAHRDGVLVAAEFALENGLRIETGLRHAKETQAAPAVATTSIPAEVTAARLRVTGDVPVGTGVTAYAEAEVDVRDASRKIAAVGADYKLGSAGRAYARYEFISSLTGPYGLNSQQRQNSTVFGISTDYMKDGNLFSEYRIRDAISGGDAEAAVGLRNLWHVSDGFAVNTGFERVHSMSGPGQGESTAATVGMEYTASPLWRGSTRFEWRQGFSSDSILATVAAASKLNRDWTLLGRNTYSVIKNKGQSTGEIEQDRLQAGLAYRDTETERLNALGRVEHRGESDSTQQGITLKRTVDLISIHASWQPRRPFTFGGRFAAKWTDEKSNGLASRSNAQLISGRATWDVTPRWDVSLVASGLLSRGTKSRQYGLGLEVGYMLIENLWVSAGYNIFGYREEDLASGEYTNKGFFLRMRYKFDEDLFSGDRNAKAANATAKPALTSGLEKSGGSSKVNGEGD